MKKKVIMILILLILLICAVVSIYKIYLINDKYPNPDVISYNQGENIKGGDITITAESSHLFTTTQIKEIIPDYISHVSNKQGTQINENQIKVLIVELKLKNNSDVAEKMSFANIVAQSKAWSNGCDFDLYSQLNNMNSIYVTLAANEEKDIKLPYLMYDFQFKEGEWKTVNERDFSLVLSVYPIKNIVRLIIS